MVFQIIDKILCSYLGEICGNNPYLPARAIHCYVISHLALSISKACIYTPLSMFLHTLSSARASSHRQVLRKKSERTIECLSLVYPDLYKKGLGNKARSSVHIGMC